MRYIRYLFLAVLAIGIVVISMANRNIVTLSLLPEELAGFAKFNWTAEVPLFVVGFSGLVAGLLIGFFWEWMREAKHRAEASRNRRETARLQREVSRLKKAQSGDDKDDVLALIEDDRKAG
ncbi:uncharacterized protein DUF1049 [Rhodovulum imhoffii]|uniref:Uncharacterized protein DUF1049 n=1 Tax=Rhodovulum imhoffii TaxID=365340 RepID=A0A2T5BST9_9RHOB|nr:LapA family protein [Rhodovulum imhoffii]MBK5934998.1 DUF1049 domain-containing protein [Rhodovulum imhoffii]PTN02457.1 uncharacterized protein DUF1049 [Rhodovulum imhoffii]